jgi:hypothetical protein
MSVAKAAFESLKGQKCKKIKLPKCPPILNDPEKDSVQEMVSALKAESLKTLIGKGTELGVPIWHSRMRDAFLIHVGSASDTIKKGDTSRPTTKPMKSMWSNANW